MSNLIDAFDIMNSTNSYLSTDDSFAKFSHYFMFLTLKNGGCSKSSSGSLQITYPQHYEVDETKIYCELGGYDCQNLSRHHHLEADSELHLKQILIDLFEIERKSIISNQ